MALDSVQYSANLEASYRRRTEHAVKLFEQAIQQPDDAVEITIDRDKLTEFLNISNCLFSKPDLPNLLRALLCYYAAFTQANDKAKVLLQDGLDAIERAEWQGVFPAETAFLRSTIEEEMERFAPSHYDDLAALSMGNEDSAKPLEDDASNDVSSRPDDSPISSSSSTAPLPMSDFSDTNETRAWS